jgi:sugar/nucleoside kinase (ribokinase family)
LRQILHRIDILSPNAEEAFGLLSFDKTRFEDHSAVEQAAARLLSFGVGKDGSGYVIIRCGAMGAYGARTEGGIVRGWWIPAYWGPEDIGVVDVTGKTNCSEHNGTLAKFCIRCWECVFGWTLGRTLFDGRGRSRR